jgi:hypothetical protein
LLNGTKLSVWLSEVAQTLGDLRDVVPGLSHRARQAVPSGRGLSPPLRPDMTRAASRPSAVWGAVYCPHVSDRCEQISQAKNQLNQSMTMEQLLEAEQKAAEWMRKMRKIPPSSIENPPNASTA